MSDALKRILLVGTLVQLPAEAVCPRGAQKNMGAMADGESDEFKRILLEGTLVP